MVISIRSCLDTIGVRFSTLFYSRLSGVDLVACRLPTSHSDQLLSVADTAASVYREKWKTQRAPGISLEPRGEFWRRYLLRVATTRETKNIQLTCLVWPQI